MYEKFFGFCQRPFAVAPDAHRYFPAASIDAALSTLLRVVQRGEGPALVVGPAGTGKSLLVQVLADRLKGRFATAILAGGRLSSRRELLQWILHDLGQPYRGLDEGELRLSLIDLLSSPNSGFEALALLVDEAHSLPLRLVDELRMVSNVVRAGEPRVRLILAGGQLLEERFSSPRMESFSQRLAARCYLEAMTRDETAAYVNAHIAWAGAEPNTVFDATALARIHAASDGVPRIVSQVCDHALLLAGLARRRPIDGEIVDEAWADLQQLPTNWSAGAAKPSSDRVVEFGGLDESAPDPPPSIPFPRSSRSEPTGAAVLARIESEVDRLEEEFLPIGTIVPEVDLIFNDQPNPFGETFDEEEIVLDRYSTLEPSFWGGRPHVTTGESEDLAMLLRQFSELAIQPVETLDTFDASSEPLLVDAPPAFTAVWEPEPVASAAHSAWPSVQGQSDEAPFCAVGPEDANLIVVDDEPPPADTPIAQPCVRPPKYNRLFLQLRRG